MIVFAAVLAFASVLVLVPGSPRTRLRRLAAAEPEEGQPGSRLFVLAAVVGAGGLGLLVGGPLGVVVALAVGAVGLWLVRREGGETDENNARLLPEVAELLAATIAVGAALPAAIDATARAVDEPASSALRRASAALALGAPVDEAWRRAGPAFAPVGVAFARAASSGAALSGVLSALAADVRHERRVTVEVAARAAGVKAVAPLVVCFLPAFVLIGVLPIVVSLASTLLTP